MRQVSYKRSELVQEIWDGARDLRWCKRSDLAQALTHLILSSVKWRIRERWTLHRNNADVHIAVRLRKYTQSHRRTSEDARYINELQTSLESQVSPVTLSFDRRAHAGSTGVTRARQRKKWVHLSDFSSVGLYTPHNCHFSPLVATQPTAKSRILDKQNTDVRKLESSRVAT